MYSFTSHLDACSRSWDGKKAIHVKGETKFVCASLASVYATSIYLILTKSDSVLKGCLGMNVWCFVQKMNPSKTPQLSSNTCFVSSPFLLFLSPRQDGKVKCIFITVLFVK